MILFPGIPLTMIRILLFASLKEIFGQDVIELNVEDKNLKSVDRLLDFLVKNKQGPWVELEKKRKHIRVAVNHEIVSWNHIVKQGDDIAFLPPITGG